MPSVEIPSLKATEAIRPWPSSFSSDFGRFPAFYKLSPSNRSLEFYRNFKRQAVKINNGRGFGHCLRKVFDNSEENKLRNSECKSCKAAKFMHNNEDCTCLEKLTSPTTTWRSKRATFLDFRDLIIPVQNQLKFMILCGFFTLQSTQHTFAGTDIVHQLQSTASLGDLDDISTGILADLFLRAWG